MIVSREKIFNNLAREAIARRPEIEIGDDPRSYREIAYQHNIKFRPNVAVDPADAGLVSRIIVCGQTSCNRLIVEYGDDIPETRHSRGLSENTLTLIREVATQVTFEEVRCDHHGGKQYEAEV